MKTAAKENTSHGVKEKWEYQKNYISVSVGLFGCRGFVCGDALCTGPHRFNTFCVAFGLIIYSNISVVFRITASDCSFFF